MAQLPFHPSLEQLRKQAKDILKRKRASTLAEAQLAVARLYGFSSWAKLKTAVAKSTEDAATALHRAAGRGDLERLEAILDAHPELVNDLAGRGVRTPLHAAVGGSQEAAVRLLLERGADPNIRCEGDNAYPLHFACEKQNFPIIRLLIEHGGDPIGQGDYHELDVIGWATVWPPKPNPEIVSYLLAHGARHTIPSAVSMGEVDVLRELVARSPADLERRMDLANKRRMPLHLAVVKRQTGALKALLELGAKTEALDEAGFSALDQAAMMGDSEAAEVLLHRGAKMRLPAAVALGRIAEMHALLKKDPECLKAGGRWENLIVRAAEAGADEAVERLLAAGASVDARDDPKTAVDSTWGYTALHAAAFGGKKKAVEVLLKHGANVRLRETRWHGTPAGWANFAGHFEVRDLILKGPVDLMEAIESGLTDRVRQILEEDPESLERPLREYPLYPMYAEGWYTPLAFAVSMGQTEVARLLIERGAQQGREMSQLAKEKGFPNIAEMLDNLDRQG